MPQRVSLIIPIYNEAAHLERFLQTIDHARYPLEKELVLINDGSTDDTTEILAHYPFSSSHQIISLPANQGKGSAIRQGIESATGEIIGIQDADFEYDVNDIAKILQLFVGDQADVVYGTRFYKGHDKTSPALHRLANKTLTWLSNRLSGLTVTDMETCYKFFRREIISNIRLESPRFGFEPEITAKLGRLKLRFAEIPVSYQARSILAGKKIGWRDGFAALWHIVYFNRFAAQARFFHPGMPGRYISGP